MRYSLQGADSGFFSLDEISGILRLERSLADETKSTYEMKVKATDRGLPRHLFSFATITVHVVILSDYQPLFLSSEYSVQIPESLQIGSEVISVSSLTKDGTESEPVRYTIISGNEDGRFQINSMTGTGFLIEVSFLMHVKERCPENRFLLFTWWLRGIFKVIKFNIFLKMA